MGKGFTKAGSGLFQKAVQRAGVFGHVLVAQRIHVVEKVFAERFGDGFALHAKPKYIKAKTLGIEVAHPAISEQLRQQEEALIGAINAAAEETIVERIQLLLPNPDRE